MSDQRVPYGAQPERTELAWRRTALALVVGSVAAARLLIPQGGVWLVVATAAGLAVSVALLIAASRRHATTAAPPDGRLLVACTLVTVLIGGAALSFVV